MISVRRKWVHAIWPWEQILQVREKDWQGLENLILEHGELIVARAWRLYVNEDPPKYHLEPLNRYIEHTRKDGGKWTECVEDQSVVTRFVLAAFLSVAEGYLIAAQKYTGTAVGLEAWQKEFSKYLKEA